LETVKFRPKRDRRARPRTGTTDTADRAYDRRRRGEEHGLDVNEADRKPGEGDGGENQS
jgi:hypothetical protein